MLWARSEKRKITIFSQTPIPFIHCKCSLIYEVTRDLLLLELLQFSRAINIIFAELIWNKSSSCSEKIKIVFFPAFSTDRETRRNIIITHFHHQFPHQILEQTSDKTKYRIKLNEISHNKIPDAMGNTIRTAERMSFLPM